MKTIFKEGDRVFDIRFGWGKIFEIDITEVNHFWVVFGDNDCRKYNNDGTYSDFDIIPMLSFTEYTLQGFSQERPKKEPEYDALCIFSNCAIEFKEGKGYVDRFYSYDKEGYYQSFSGIKYKFCKQIEIKEL